MLKRYVEFVSLFYHHQFQARGQDLHQIRLRQCLMIAHLHLQIVGDDKFRKKYFCCRKGSYHKKGIAQFLPALLKIHGNLIA